MKTYYINDIRLTVKDPTHEDNEWVEWYDVIVDRLNPDDTVENLGWTTSQDEQKSLGMAIERFVVDSFRVDYETN